MLESKDLGGKCADLNALYVGLARAAGLPARDVYGIRITKSELGYKSLGASSENITKAADFAIQHLNELLDPIISWAARGDSNRKKTWMGAVSLGFGLLTTFLNRNPDMVDWALRSLLSRAALPLTAQRAPILCELVRRAAMSMRRFRRTISGFREICWAISGSYQVLGFGFGRANDTRHVFEPPRRSSPRAPASCVQLSGYSAQRAAPAAPVADR